MKTILSRVRRFVSGLSMRTKLIVAFSVPVILVMALTMLGVDSSSLYIIKGAIILVAVSLDMRKYLVKK